MAVPTKWRKGDDVKLEGSDTEKRVLEWIVGYLATKRPNPAQWGQPAAMDRPLVCPFMPQADKANSIWVTEWPGVTKASATLEIIERHRDQFHDILEPREGHRVLHKTALFVFPDVPEENAIEAIDGVQATLKPNLMERDSMMIGQFHPWSDLDAFGPNSGKNIKPFRSPVPLIALRVMVHDDWDKFIAPELPNRPEDRVSEFVTRQEWRLSWLTALLEWDFPQRLAKLFPPDNVTTWRDEWQSEFNRIAEFLEGLGPLKNRIASARR
jgi:hypothetical protein